MAPKVLLVDDDRLIHRLYQPHIHKAGYELLSAYKGTEALEIAARELPGVIIMDIMMPELDGLSAMRELKRDERTKNIPVIVITANPQYHLSRMESQWAGAALFLTKPFGPPTLVSALQRVLPGSNAGKPETPPKVLS